MGVAKYSRIEIRKACELAGVDPNGVIPFLDNAREMCAKSKTPPSPLTAKIIDAYHNWYLDTYGVKPNILVQDGVSARRIGDYLCSAVTAKNPDCDREENASLAWIVILTNIDKWDKFYQKQVSLSQIGKNLNNIIANIRSNGRKQIAGGIDPGIARIVEQRYGGGL